MWGIFYLTNSKRYAIILTECWKGEIIMIAAEVIKLGKKKPLITIRDQMGRSWTPQADLNPLNRQITPVEWCSATGAVGTFVLTPGTNAGIITLNNEGDKISVLSMVVNGGMWREIKYTKTKSGRERKGRKERKNA